MYESGIFSAYPCYNMTQDFARRIQSYVVRQNGDGELRNGIYYYTQVPGWRGNGNPQYYYLFYKLYEHRIYADFVVTDDIRLMVPNSSYSIIHSANYYINKLDDT